MIPEPEARRLMAEHVKMVERIVQSQVNLGHLQRRDFEEACSFGRVGLAEAANRYDASRGRFETWAWIRIYGAVCNGMKKERRERRRLLLTGDEAAGEYSTGLRAPEEAAELSQEEALSRMREAGEGFVAAMVLGYLSGIWRLDPQAQVLAREEHPRALAVLAEETGRLAEREQRLLRLRYAEERGWEEIARELGAAKATVERWHAAALQRLGKRLRARAVEASPRPVDTG